MPDGSRPDCVIIGYNETPFAEWEGVLRQYGEDSEAYRDLRLSFVDLGDAGKQTYVGLLNHAYGLASGRAGAEPFKSGDIPNLAAVYLCNYLRRRGWRAEYVNLFQHEKDRLAGLLRAGPACVAVTTTFYVTNLPVYEMVRFIREQDPRVPVVVGGPLVANHARSYRGEELAAALRDTGGDIFIHESQGEATLERVVACLRSGGSLASLPNVWFFEDGLLRGGAVEPENNSLDEEAIGWTDFRGEALGATVQTRTARSCAFNCSFCNYPTRAGKLALASLETIERELDALLAVGVRNVVFIDDTFNVPVNRFKDICRLMIRKRYGFRWFSYLRCSNADEECADLMAESGCAGVFLGIESGSPTILKNMNKAATVEKYARGIDWLRRRGILTFASFITGFPGETEETVQETIDFLRENRPDYYRSQMWYCEPGTPIVLQRDLYGIEGEGFVWSHATMDSLEAMDHIERMFLTVRESEWLPQWSFDFWIIPYLQGKGISAERFRSFMHLANRLLALDLGAVPAAEKPAARARCLEALVSEVRKWAI